MHKDNKVAVKSDLGMVILDLQDIPHGKLVDTRKDDQYDIEFYEVPESLQVPSYNPSTRKIEWMPVKFWSIHRGKKLEVVTLSDGSQIYTDNDPRAIYGIAADADTAEPHRFTPTSAKEHNVLVPITTESFGGISSAAYYDFATGLISDTKSDHSALIDFNLGQFIGIMAGDGWCDNERRTYLADNEGYNIDFVTKVLSVIYPVFSTSKKVMTAVEDTSRYGDSVKYYLAVNTLTLGDRIKELVDGHGDDQTSGSANKRLPEWFQFAGKDFIHGLVCGLIATDGTVAVSHSKDKPQLRIQFTSTSLRLAREFQRCCHILGVRCSVAFSKDTSGGNRVWNCTVSTVDAKKVNLLEKCCHDRKRDIFINTAVETGAKFVKNDVLPFPKDISSTIVSLIPSIKNPSTDEEKSQYSLCIGVRKYAANGMIPRAFVANIVDFASKFAKENKERYSRAEVTINSLKTRLNALASSTSCSSKFIKVIVSDEEEQIIRNGIDSCKSGIRDNSIAGTMLKMLYSVRKKGVITVAQLKDLILFFSSYTHNDDLVESQALKTLQNLANSEVKWVTIDHIQKTDIEIQGYDLTVPGYDTFVNADGVVLSNTVNIHVPASEKASKEALDKMLPSKNLFSLTDMKSVRYKPEKEQISGLWALTSGMTNKPVKVYNTKEEAIAAYRHGDIGPNDPVEIRK